MLSEKYRVHVSGLDLPDGDYNIDAVEIIPPVPESLEGALIDKTYMYLMDQDPDSDGIEVNVHGFCDRGRGVNTIITLDPAPAFYRDGSGNKVALEGLRRVVEGVISPSGAAIARD